MNKRKNARKMTKKEWAAAYYQRNRKFVDAKNKKYYLKNKAKVLAYTKNYYDTHRSSFNSWKRKNEGRRGIQVDITPEEYRSIISSSCAYCGLNRFIGVDRVDSSIGYLPGNCVACCKYCNYGKYTMSAHEFVEHCARVVEFHVKKEGVKSGK